MENAKINQITIAQLIQDLEIFDKDSILVFGDDELSFYRTKRRGNKLVQIEFNEIILTQEPLVKDDY